MSTFSALNEFEVMAQCPLVSIEECPTMNFRSPEDSCSNTGVDTIRAKVAG